MVAEGLERRSLGVGEPGDEEARGLGAWWPVDPALTLYGICLLRFVPYRPDWRPNIAGGKEVDHLLSKSGSWYM